MALFEFRWWLNAAAAELVLMVAVWTSLASNRSRASRSVALAVCILAGLLVFTRIHGIVRNVSESAVTPADAMQPIYRDAASAIRNTRPESSVVLLSSPNASTSITYFGRFKAIGTLYWEDVDGLRAAAKILTSSSDDQARVLLQARGITHIALFSRDNFVQEYLELLGEPDQPVKVARTFGYRLLSNGSPPPWLRPIGLRLPGAAEPGLTARIYQIVPEQNELEARWNLGIARLVEGDTMTAESTFLEAINGVATARRSLLYATAGAIAYQQKAQALAVRLLGLALPSADDRQVRVNLAWILATSVDGRIRDGARAFALIEPVARAFPENASVLDVYAAALAETGRFPQAAEVMSRTLELGKQAMRGPDLGKMSERLNAYRSGRPWRQ